MKKELILLFSCLFLIGNMVIAQPRHNSNHPQDNHLSGVQHQPAGQHNPNHIPQHQPGQSHTQACHNSGHRPTHNDRGLHHNNWMPNHQPCPHPNYHPSPVYCTDAECNHIFKELKNENFDDNRLRLAETFVQVKMMSAIQIRKLATSFTFESNKLEFLEFAYAFCVDKPNYYVCRDVLKFRTDQDKLLEFIRY